MNRNKLTKSKAPHVKPTCGAPKFFVKASFWRGIRRGGGEDFLENGQDVGNAEGFLQEAGLGRGLPPIEMIP